MKKNLTYFSTIAAALALVIAGISYLLNSYPKIAKEFTWKENIEVLSITDDEGVMVVNTGDGRVIISRIRILFKCWQTRTKYDESTYLKALKKRGSPLLEYAVSA